MWNLPNLITLLRLPLALFFYPASNEMRIAILILAGLSDGLDGFLARRWNQTTSFGTILDPIMDKLFAAIVIGTLLWESYLTPWECSALFSRDIAVLLYGVYLWLNGTLKTYRVKAIWSGKIATTLQFAVFILLLAGVTIPPAVYLGFGIIGCAALAELSFRTIE
ncbi:MAG: CDP-alcohol phosphatidyltransferase family protein [Parachlamydiales bacterium]